MDAIEIQPIRGARDVLPPRRAMQKALERRLQEVFALYGYEPIDTPVLEPAELFLRKNGEAIAARMYAFSHWNRDLCLRPEFTASVIRAYVNHLQARPLPVRLQYAGPSFRYEKPQQARDRQFTEVGAECIGASGPGADAEVLALARHGLEAVGVSRFRFVVGHLGAVLGLLAQLGMDERAQSLVLAEMEHLARAPAHGQRVVERLAAMLAGPPESGEGGEDLGSLLQSLGAEGARQVTTDLLDRANLSLDGGPRRPEEIVERLLRKTRRPDPAPALASAVEFIQELREARGPPEEALPAVRRLLGRWGLDDQPVGDVERVLAYFGAYFPQPSEVQVDLSLARGLRYYTGLVFEVYDDEGNQLAGGGRYDDLARALGGRQPVPACGFCYGLERVLAAVEREGKALAGDHAVSVLVAPLTEEDCAAGAQLTGELRRAGIATELDVQFRGPKANLRHADRHKIPLVLLLGEEERGAGLVTLRDLRGSEEVRVPLAEVTGAIRSRLRDL